MPPLDQLQLSRRERQIMDIIFEQGECSAQDVLVKISNPPSYSSIRALISRLCEKEILDYRLQGTRHIYRARLEPEEVQESAVKRLLKTFFKGSRVNAFNALLDLEGENLSETEISQLERSIERIRNAQKRK